MTDSHLVCQFSKYGHRYYKNDLKKAIVDELLAQIKAGTKQYSDSSLLCTHRNKTTKPINQTDNRSYFLKYLE